LENPNDHEALFKKLIANECSPEEVLLLMEWLDSRLNEEEALRLIRDQLGAEADPAVTDTELRQRLKDRLGQIDLKEHRSPAPRIWKYAAAAAAIFISILIGGRVLLRGKRDTEKAIAADGKTTLKKDVLPGGNKAVLTLSDGSTIVLDSAANGTISRTRHVKIVKEGDGQLRYVVSGTAAVSEASAASETPAGKTAYNTLSTPKGGQYKITLPDGSDVWLNAASSIRFPQAFKGKERRVEITGEAYFEVTKDTEHPFVVQSDDLSIEVLGTHFDVNGYKDNGVVKTTLLEGKVRASNAGPGISHTQLLMPGEQVIAAGDGGLQKNSHPDLAEVIAWKNGIFKFNHAPLQAVLKQLERWYNIEVVYERKPPVLNFGGEISRSSTLAQVLQILDYSGINFSIEGRKLIVH